MMPEAANYIDIPFVLTEYRNNELNAEEKYKGRLIETKGVVDRITLSWAGTPSLSLRPIEASNNPFADNMTCDIDKEAARTLAHGQQVTVRARVKDVTLGVLVTEKCEIVK